MGGNAQCYGELFQIVERDVARLALDVCHESSVEPGPKREFFLAPLPLCPERH